MENSHIKALFRKYLDNTYTESELDEILLYFHHIEDEEDLDVLVQQELKRLADEEPIDRELMESMSANIERKIFSRARPPRRFNPTTWALVASSAVLFISLVFYLFLTYNSTETKLTSQSVEDVAPGTNRAYITLSDGQHLELDSTRTAVKAIDGKLFYEDGTELLAGTALEYATITTPVGGEYQMILPDGTKAWLNAQSSLKYPLHFAGKERQIEANGEVYLEVVQDKARPFKVITGQQRIEVLGTEFNIRNYSQRTITTLVQGSIALENNQTKEHITLTPGDQSILAGERIKVSKVQPSDYTAWVSGIILNKDASLVDICRELERWYGVRFIFPKGFDNQERALISIDRQEMLSAVLASFEKTYHVQFTIKGKEVFVR